MLLVVSRLAIEVPNFKPVLAIALFSGFVFGRFWLAALVPALGMLISNIPMDFYQLGAYQWQLTIPIILALIVTVGAGRIVKNFAAGGNQTDIGRMIVGISGSVCLTAIAFFFLSNLTFWAFSGVYPKTISGLLTCYVMGLPFLKMTFLSHLGFSTLLFGAYVLLAQPLGLENCAATAKNRSR